MKEKEMYRGAGRTHAIYRGGTVTSLEPLTECAKLETVYVNYDVLPVEIPENAGFTVLLMN